MNDSYRLVNQLAAQLQAEGKTPSLALIRARAGKGIDAVALFSAYQQWRAQAPTTRAAELEQQENTGKLEHPNDAPSTSLTPTADIHVLQQDIQRLEQKIEQLSGLITQLIQQSQR